MGFELMTSSLPRMRSTPELHRLNCLSGKRGSNSRPSAWKADALPTELLPQFAPQIALFSAAPRHKSILFCARLARKFRVLLRCGQGWVRTTVGVSRQIYSLLRLTTPALALVVPMKLRHRVEPMGGFEPSTPRLQITCSGQLSYIG